MAKFNINIAAEVVTPYTSRNHNITTESCISETVSYEVNMNISDTNPEVPVPTAVYLLGTYTGDAWKTLTISNIVYSDSVNFYLELSGVPMNINTVYNIDVSLLSPGVNIPNLLAKSIVTAGETSSKTISYKISITDINDVVWDYVISDVDLVLTDCLTPVEPIVGCVTNTITPPTEYIDFCVTSAPFSNLNFQYKVTTKSSGGFFGGLIELDEFGSVIRVVSSMSNSVGPTFNIIDTLGVENIRYYRFIVTTREEFPISGVEEDTFTDVTLYLRNNLNDATLYSFNILIGFTTDPTN